MHNKLTYSRLFLCILFLVSSGTMNTSTAQKIISMNNLRNAITAEFDTQSGLFACAFYNLASDQALLINADSVFHAASTMKTPVMIEVFRQAKAGRFSLTDSVSIKNNFRSIVDGSYYQLDSLDDSESEIYRHIGEKRTIYDLTYQMIINSSNLATNLIIDLVGAKNVMKTMRHEGTTKMKVLRGVEDQKAYDAGLNNTTTARDLMILYRKMAEGTLIDSNASNEMIRILEDQTHNNIIPALLPKDVRVAHKTGNITGVEHDSGIVFLPDGRKYVLVLLSKNLKDRDAAVGMMARVSRLIYTAMASH